MQTETTRAFLNETTTRTREFRNDRIHLTLDCRTILCGSRGRLKRLFILNLVHFDKVYPEAALHKCANCVKILWHKRQRGEIE